MQKGIIDWSLFVSHSKIFVHKIKKNFEKKRVFYLCGWVRVRGKTVTIHGFDTDCNFQEAICLNPIGGRHTLPALFQNYFCFFVPNTTGVSPSCHSMTRFPDLVHRIPNNDNGSIVQNQASLYCQHWAWHQAHAHTICHNLTIFNNV